MQKFAILTTPYRLMVASWHFIFMACWGDGKRATYLYLDYMKSKYIDWNAVDVSLIIHVVFDHVWIEHYPITLNTANNM